MTDKEDSRRILINVRVEPEQKVFIDSQSKHEDRPVASYIRCLIEKEMDRLAEQRVLNDE